MRDLLLRVSVIVPVYNANNHLEKCFNSLCQQTLRPKEFEIIFIDDCSTDDSVELIKEFKNRRENVRLILNPQNIGAGLSRNKALKIAKGEYIYFLDSDDYIDQTTLERMLMVAYDNESDLVISGFNRIKEDGEIIYKNVVQKGSSANRLSLLKGLLSFEIPPIIGGRLVRRSLLKKHHIWFEAGMHEDVLINLKMFFYAKNIEVISEYFYYWVTHHQASSSFIAEKDIDGLLESLKNSDSFLNEEADIGLYRKLNEAMMIGTCKCIKDLLNRIHSFNKDNEGEKIRLYKYLYKQINNAPKLRNAILSPSNPHPIVNQFFEIYHNNVDPDCASKMFEYIIEPRKDLPINARTSSNGVKKTILSRFPVTRKIYKLAKFVFTSPDGLPLKVNYLIDRTVKFLYKKRFPVPITTQAVPTVEPINKELLFFCEANYHIRNAAIIIRNLKKKDINAAIIDFTKILGNGKRQLDIEEKNEYSDLAIYEYDSNLYNRIDKKYLKVAVFFNDWGKNHAYIRELRTANIKTVGIDEGVNDFLKLGEGFTGKVSPYRTCEYVMLPGEFETQFFYDRPKQYFITGLPMIRKLYKEPVREIKTPIAVINVNFTYGVLTNFRDKFVESAIKGCKLAGINYILTQHPMDEGVYPVKDISKADMYETIRNGSIFISRFSGAIIESLALGKPCVYHNPHDEKILKFQEPLGAYSISHSAESLAKAIKKELKKAELEPVREYSKAFMKLHANITDKEEPEDKISNILAKLLSKSN